MKIVEERFIDAGGARTHVLECGAGATVFLLHGAGPGVDAAINWSDMLPRLAGHYRCVAPDLPGFGRTAMPSPLPADARAWALHRARHLVALMDALGLARADFVGNSRGGGATLLHLAMIAPERCQRLVVMGGGGVPLGGPAKSIGKVFDFYENPTVEAMSELMRFFVHDPATLSEPLETIAARRREQALVPGAREAFRAMSRGPAFNAEDVEQLRRIDHRTLLVHGARDAVSSPDASVQLQQLLPNAHLHVLPNAAHWSHVDGAKAFATLVHAFFDERLD